MESNQVSKSEFKAKALQYFRQVEASGESMVITDNGEPVLEVRPYRSGERRPFEVLRGSVARCVDSTASVDVTWEVESDEELGALADAAMLAAERACDSIDDALAFVAASVKRIAAVEAQAAVGAFDPVLKGQI